MRILFVFVLFSQISFSQITPIKKIGNGNLRKGNTLSSSTAINQLHGNNFVNADSVKIKRVITSSGDTIAPIDAYKIFRSNGISHFDTILNIKKQYQFNYLRKDLFGLLGYSNDGLTYQALNPFYMQSKSIANFGFNARSFSYLGKDDIYYYNVPTPASELMYRSVTDKGQNLDALLTLNTSEQLNFFVGYRGLRSQGKYQTQLTSNGNFRIGSSFTSKNKRYFFKNHITFQDVINEENGGLLNVSNFTSGNDDFNNRSLLDVQMRDATTLFKGIRTYFDHSFQFNKSTNNKALVRHQFTYEYLSNLYQQRNTNPLNNVNPYFGSAFSNSIYDKVRHKRFENTFDVAFDNKAIGVFAVSAGVYNLTQEYNSIVFDALNNKIPNSMNHDIVTLGGSYVYENDFLNADAQFKQSVVGSSLTDFVGNVSFNINNDYIFKGSYHFESKLPDFTYQFFQSGYLGLNWYNHFANEKIHTVSAIVTSPFINLEGSYKLMNDYLYFKNIATSLNANGQFNQLLASPEQHADVISYFSIKAQKEFSYKKWALDNTIMFQNVTQSANVLNVPTVVTRNTLYYSDFAFKKALYFQTGIVFNYFTKYYANEYHPVLGDFVVQDQVKIGNFPMFDFFLNAKIKTANIYLNVDHFNAKLTGSDYRNTPTYPYRDLTFRLGIKWNFFN